MEGSLRLGSKGSIVQQITKWFTSTVSSVYLFDIGSDLDWHLISLDTFQDRYATSLAKGLSLDVVQFKLQDQGGNEFGDPFRYQIWTSWWYYLTGGFGYVLWICFLVALLSYKPLGSLNGAIPDITNLGLAGFILFIIVFQIIINMCHDQTVQRIANALEQTIPHSVSVVRQGQSTAVNKNELVVGDLVLLKPGFIIPADIRITKCSSNMRLDPSKLTGQEVHVACTIEATHKNFMESHNVALAGGYIVQGYGRGIVVATGSNTVMGKINDHHPAFAPQLKNELKPYVKFISIVALGFSTILILVWYFWSRTSYPGFISLASAITSATTIIVAFIPEGLSFGLTLTLAILSRRMIQNHTLVKDLSCIGLAGTISALILDKTGTLTEQDMQVDIVVLDRTYTKSEIHQINTNLSAKLMTILSLCNSQVYNHFDPDATDRAIVKFTNLVNQPKSKVRIRKEPTFMMALANTALFGDQPILMVKGAPEYLLPYCRNQVTETGQLQPIDADEINQLIEFHSNQAKRVLLVGYAMGVTSLDGFALSHNTPLIYVGLIGLANTPRPEALDMIHQCQQAGILIIIMTGDHPTTATAIARQVGIPPPVLTSDKLNQLDSFQQPLVLARMNSYQKLKVVHKLQAQGYVVGMVGDGINDIPSLKAADVGFAMGSSCEMALASSQIILINNNLANIPQLIHCGRQLLTNIKTLVNVIPAGSLSETLPILGNILLGFPQPLNSFLMTITSLITDILPSVAILANASDPKTMRQPPRQLKHQPIIKYGHLIKSFLIIGVSDAMIAHFAYFSYFYYQSQLTPLQLLFSFQDWQPGFQDLSKSQLNHLQYTGQSIFFATIVTLQIMKHYLMTHITFNSLPRRLNQLRNTPNLWYLISASISIIVACLLLYLPIINHLFNTRPLNLIHWSIVIAWSIMGVLLFEGNLCIQKFNKTKISL